MLNMSEKELEEIIDDGHLNYSFNNGEMIITLYDLEKYMGADQTQKITAEYLSNSH